LPGAAHMALGTTRLQTAWRRTRTGRRKTPQKKPMLQPLSGIHLTPLGIIRFPEPLPDLFRLAGSHFPLDVMHASFSGFPLSPSSTPQAARQHTPSR